MYTQYMRHISPYSDKLKQKENPLMLLLAVLSVFALVGMLACI